MSELIMRKLKGLTRIDVAVTLACIAFILAEASVLNAGGRERSKRELCLSNLRMLTAAWQAYANDNAGKIVNGAPQSPNPPSLGACPGCPANNYCKAVAPTPAHPDSDHWYELPWIGQAYGISSECGQKCAIETGALWKYAQNLDLYRCTVGERNELVTYVVLDGMNGMTATRGPVKTSGVWKKNTNQIIKPASRLVFIDNGRLVPDSFAVYYNTERWFDMPPVQHENGLTVSFADGHSAFRKWKSQETITIGKGGIYNVAPKTCDAKNDLYWLQIGCWGQLGYTPTCPVNIE
jgi:prepilin-type processing-associated H-X9-DG protein